MRSMNALVVLHHHMRIPEAVQPYLADAMVGRTAKGALWVWETNISPLFARHGVTDLNEEVAILGWLLTLPREDFKLIRSGEELGELGDLDLKGFSNPFRTTRECQEMVLAYEHALLEVTPDSEGRLWSRGHPEHVGWYLANPTRTPLSWRFWNGKNWSTVGLRGMTVADAAECAKRPECDAAEKMMWWSDFWPEGLPLNRTCPPPPDDVTQV
ncbi:hypothetical protein WJ96_06150 [Burkholderia ubonensis]|uniref:Uncharacterized protein n=2 Tax=Burkholderia ubonensis TaxID=101571 RepID=A0AAW3MY83_9BURK|nr:hypothetical protein WJ96_06150 [Burkholderia ubonensis]KVZ92849.1 hypothetical protein WL25_17815 [Burkholderia ubonensis]